MTDGVSVTANPALALIDPAGMVQRSTAEFTRRCNGTAQLLEDDPRIDRILTGQTDRANMTVGGVELEAEAIRDIQGVRHVLLTARGDDATPCSSFQEHRFDESPALVWLKEMDGRYLHANRRYTELLDTSEDRLLGQTDRELPTREAVDGPRLLGNSAPIREPLHFEYTIAAFEQRPALAVLRFPVRDHAGEAVALCGVAAPLGEARVARAECARLMQLERWSRLDPLEIRQELIEEWGLVADEDPSQASPEGPADTAGESSGAEAQSLAAELGEAIAARDAAVAQREELIRETADLQQELGEGRRRIAALHEASATAARRAEELVSTLAQEQERTAQLERMLERAATAPAEVVPRDDELLREHRERAENAEAALNEAREELARLEIEVARERAGAAEALAELQRDRELAEQRAEAAKALEELRSEPERPTHDNDAVLQDTQLGHVAHLLRHGAKRHWRSWRR